MAGGGHPRPGRLGAAVRGLRYLRAHAPGHACSRGVWAAATGPAAAGGPADGHPCAAPLLAPGQSNNR